MEIFYFSFLAAADILRQINSTGRREWNSSFGFTN